MMVVHHQLFFSEIPWFTPCRGEFALKITTHVENASLPHPYGYGVCAPLTYLNS
jgi:hypothetical protein